MQRCIVTRASVTRGHHAGSCQGQRVEPLLLPLLLPPPLWWGCCWQWPGGSQPHFLPLLLFATARFLAALGIFCLRRSAFDSFT